MKRSAFGFKQTLEENTIFFAYYLIPMFNCPLNHQVCCVTHSHELTTKEQYLSLEYYEGDNIAKPDKNQEKLCENDKAIPIY
jgi:hypothetical protein